jgi:hypothetical protein
LLEPVEVRFFKIMDPQQIVQQAGPFQESDINRFAIFVEPLRQKDGQLRHGFAVAYDVRRNMIFR